MSLKMRRSASRGSSPRVRGTLVVRCGTGGRIRFIPAGAGNTRCTRLRMMLKSVHPRGCGEHGRSVGGYAPRHRFIPAGAGNTLDGRLTWSRALVHPRGCGEHTVPGSDPLRPDGSSPRVRGTRRSPVPRRRRRRFIPAGAGNTMGLTASEAHLPVHPRGCGEHTKSAAVPVW